MTDLSNRAFELAALRVEEERDCSVARSVAQLRTQGAMDCVDCGKPIGADRRAVMPSARRCIHCQAQQERGL